jgi:hypothetical protein
MLKDQIVILIVKLHMFKLHITVNGRNLSIGMTFIESRAPMSGSKFHSDRLTPVCPVKFFGEKERSGFNRGPPTSDLRPLTADIRNLLSSLTC